MDVICVSILGHKANHKIPGILGLGDTLNTVSGPEIVCARNDGNRGSNPSGLGNKLNQRQIINQKKASAVT